MKNNQKGFIIPIVIIVIALLAIGGGTYVYTKNKKTTELSTFVQSTSDFQQASSTNSINSDQQIKTYINTKFGISFQYPSDWKISQENSGFILIEDINHPSMPDSDSPFNGIMIIKDPAQKTSINWDTGFGDIPRKQIYFAENDVLVHEFAISNEYKSNEDRIVSTIKFIPINIWEGSYTFTESAPGLPNSGQPNMVEDYILTLKKEDKADQYSGEILISGFQTFSDIAITGKVVGTNLHIYFNSNIGGVESIYRKNDELFKLDLSSSTKFKIDWIKMKPNFGNTNSSANYFIKKS